MASVPTAPNKVNKLSATLAALIAGLGVAFQTNVIPNKYAGYALIAATVLQAFQKPAVSSDAVPVDPVSPNSNFVRLEDGTLAPKV